MEKMNLFLFDKTFKVFIAMQKTHGPAIKAA